MTFARRVLNGSAVALLVLAMSMRGAAPHFAVVVNAANPVVSLTKAQLKDLLPGKQAKWQEGTAVSILLEPAGNPARKAILQDCCGMTEADYAAWFVHASFKGDTLVTPKIMPSGASIMTLVQLVPGAVAVVDATAVSPRLKVVEIKDKEE